jgi:hypothetical protein
VISYIRINERFEVVQNLLDNEEVRDEIVNNLLAIGKKSTDKKNNTSPSISINTNALKILTKLNSRRSKPLVFHLRDVERELVRLEVSYKNVVKTVRDEKESDGDNEGDKNDDDDNNNNNYSDSINNGGDDNVDVKKKEVGGSGHAESLKGKNFLFYTPSLAEMNAFSVLSSRGAGGLKLEIFLMIVNYFSYINRFWLILI